MIKVTHLCTNCLDVISNPMCSNCFSQHVDLWLGDRNISPNKSRKIKRLLREFVLKSEETPADTNCIICGSRNVNFCTVCSMQKAQQIIERTIPIKEITENFNEDFNSEIWSLK